MIPTATDDAPWLTVPHWHDHTTVAVSIAHWSKTLLIPEEWLCGCVHCIQQKTGHTDIHACMRWLVCNDIIPKAIPLSERLTQYPHLARHANTIKLIELARTH